MVPPMRVLGLVLMEAGVGLAKGFSKSCQSREALGVCFLNHKRTRAEIAQLLHVSFDTNSSKGYKWYCKGPKKILPHIYCTQCRYVTR